MGLFAEAGEGIGLELGDVVTAESSSPEGSPVSVLGQPHRPSAAR